MTIREPDDRTNRKHDLAARHIAKRSADGVDAVRHRQEAHDVILRQDEHTTLLIHVLSPSMARSEGMRLVIFAVPPADDKVR